MKGTQVGNFLYEPVDLRLASWEQRWFDELPRVRIYPSTPGEFWDSPQCDSCYDVMSPTQNIKKWVELHVRHRKRMTENLPDPDPTIADVGRWGRDSFHVRQAILKAAGLDRSRKNFRGYPPQL